MFIYWMMFFMPALVALSPWRGKPSLQCAAWFFFGIFYSLVIGLRYQVGGDWSAYLQYYFLAFRGESLEFLDPAYRLLNFLSTLVGGGVFLVNFICAIFVMIGVILFSRRQPLPWLAFLISVPYLLIVVAMGYSRQGVAIGFELMALVALIDGRIRRFFLYVMCGVLFHKSAILLLPLVVMSKIRSQKKLLIWIGSISVCLGLIALSKDYESLWRNYVSNEMVSEGAYFRVALNAFPALIFLIFRKKLGPYHCNERYLWTCLAALSLACIPLMGFASTAVDRVALYFLPIQMYVFSRIYRLFSDSLCKAFSIFCVILGYGLVQWVWLNYATHASFWLPYKFYPFL